MGWNSATPYFDETMRAVLDMLSETVYADDGDEEVTVGEVSYPQNIIDMARPVAKALADKLADGDWGVQDESDFFHVYGPELLRDGRYEEYLADFEGD